MGTSLNMKSLPLSDFWAKVATGCPLTRWGGALSSGSKLSLSCICRRFAFFRFFRCRLPARWSEYWRSPLNIILQMWHGGYSIQPPGYRLREFEPKWLQCCSSSFLCLLFVASFLATPRPPQDPPQPPPSPPLLKFNIELSRFSTSHPCSSLT